MTTPKREIYSIAFNKSITDKGEVKMYVYTLGVISQNGLRIPEKITLKGEQFIVTFTDNSRHILSSVGVEVFDRVVVPKETKTK